MKVKFLLQNIYWVKGQNPNIVSSKMFNTFEDAMKKAVENSQSIFKVRCNLAQKYGERQPNFTMSESLDTPVCCVWGESYCDCWFITEISEED